MKLVAFEASILIVGCLCILIGNLWRGAWGGVLLLVIYIVVVGVLGYIVRRQKGYMNNSTISRSPLVVHHGSSLIADTNRERAATACYTTNWKAVWCTLNISYVHGICRIFYKCARYSRLALGRMELPPPFFLCNCLFHNGKISRSPCVVHGELLE